ncbi:MAG: aminotransferase class I/II-fold pyridoxal phosphate-dependent enzyme [Alphaproteobacteria bacterium]|nr:aminotransferase class I/II-fold pyridoxal phosphate-dependent enzyme [Alphaproteobacteria bacterium]
MTAIRVDLWGDSITRPSSDMKRFMMAAEVGNEVEGEDPTTIRLCEMVADLLGKEAALFVTSGTMANEVAFLVHCRRGDEIILDRSAHPLHTEVGGPAALSGAITRPLDGARGVFTAAQLEAAIRPPSRQAPRPRLVSIEQTSNLHGGAIWPLEAVEAVAAVARRHGLAVHLDGARLLNATVALGVPPKAFAAAADSVFIALTKGLGCPIGSVLAGSRAFIDEAWRWRQQLGGGMRQVGIIAAAGIYALENNVERLAEDHDNAQHLARGLADIPGVEIDPAQVETNIVHFGVAGSGLAATEIRDALLTEGVRMRAIAPMGMRALTHMDVSRAGIDEALTAFRRVVDRASGTSQRYA